MIVVLNYLAAGAAIVVMLVIVFGLSWLLEQDFLSRNTWPETDENGFFHLGDDESAEDSEAGGSASRTPLPYQPDDFIYLGDNEEPD